MGVSQTQGHPWLEFPSAAQFTQSTCWQDAIPLTEE